LRASGREPKERRPVEAGRMDWYSFTVAFKGVLLEGLEVTFIVVTFGQHAGPARACRRRRPAAAVVAVVAVGLVVRGPLERVPENALKFGVGILLTSFGIFWAGEGAGVSWPGEDLAILGVIAYVGLSPSRSRACCAAGGPRSHPWRPRA
jgi:uncharacterized membrane protein